jgi:Protein of unknown function (DUF3040)
VPLSEHEQRLLEQMERALLAEDPKFATSMSAQSRVKADKRGATIGVFAFLGGIGLLMAGVITQLIPVGVVGFVAMLVGALLTVRSLKHRVDTPDAGNVTSMAAKRKSKSKSKKTFEDRWRERRERGDF